MRLLLLRHGQTPANVLGSLDTAAPGPGLTALGTEQAQGIVPRLDGEHIDTLYISSLVRTSLTAAPLAQVRGLEPIERAGLREIEAGTLEKRTDMPSVMDYVETVARWGEGDLAVRMPGGHTGTEVMDRFDEVIEEILGTGAGTAAIVSHGAMIRLWVARRAAEDDTGFIRERPLDNTGLAVVERTSRGWSLDRWDGLPHGTV